MTRLEALVIAVFLSRVFGVEGFLCDVMQDPENAFSLGLRAFRVYVYSFGQQFSQGCLTKDTRKTNKGGPSKTCKR